jgi:Inner membrane protein YgaP-like, transmembrane domain
MTVERSLRLLAGFFVLLSLALGYWVSPWWFLFTAFVGLNLLQSGFTNWCPAMAIFRKMGLPEVGTKRPGGKSPRAVA